MRDRLTVIGALMFMSLTINAQQDSLPEKILDTVTVNTILKSNYYLAPTEGMSVNNFTDERYFNRRITMYPGPGILPTDGRTFYIAARIKI